MATLKEKYRVQVTNMERFSDKGNLKAFVDIKVGTSLRICGFRIVQQPGQKSWVSAPQRTWKDKEGKDRYSPIVELSGELKEAVDESIMQEYSRE